MMKIAIWGAGAFCRFVYDLAEGKLGEVVCFIDKDAAHKQGLPVPVLSPQAYAAEPSADEVWVAHSSFYVIEDILWQMHTLGMTQARVIAPAVWEQRKPAIQLDSPDAYQLDLREKAVICKLEFHVTDRCNLNCLGCSHFAPIFGEASDADIGAFERDVRQLAAKFANILTFRLMGGEPFLNPRLDEYIAIARRYFPNTHLRVVTNGLLYREVEDRIWQSIIANDVFVQVSLYPPTLAIRDALQAFLDAKGIPNSFGSGLRQANDIGRIDEFHKCFTTERTHDPAQAAAHCFGNRCHFLRDGKLSKCAVPLLIGDVNRYFGTDYQVVPEDFVDLYSDMRPWEMLARLRHATPFCGYCLERGVQRFAWDVTKSGQARLEDYVVE